MTPQKLWFVMSFAGTIWKMTAVSDGDALIPVSWDRHVYRYDAGAMTTVVIPPTPGMGTENWYYDTVALPNGDALVASDGLNGKVVRYDGAAKTLGAGMMSYAGTMGPMVAVSDGDALIPISAGAQVWRYDSATRSVPETVATGMGTAFYDTLALPNGDALIASDGLNGKVVRYDGATKTTGGNLMSHAGTIGPMALISGGDALIPISAGAQVWRYDAATRSVPEAVATGMGTEFYDVEALANGDALIASDGAGGKVVRYDAAAGTTGGSLMTGAGVIGDILALPDGDALIFAETSGGSLWRYDAATQSVPGQPIGTFLGTFFDMAALLSLSQQLMGDADLDGDVDDDDLSLLLANWGQDVTGDSDGGWGKGEFTATAPVNDDDLRVCEQIAHLSGMTGQMRWMAL